MNNYNITTRTTHPGDKDFPKPMTEDEEKDFYKDYCACGNVFYNKEEKELCGKCDKDKIVKYIVEQMEK